MPKLGQKLTDNPKDKWLQVRTDEETLWKLDCIVEKQNTNRSKVVRDGIEMQYKKLNK